MDVWVGGLRCKSSIHPSVRSFVRVAIKSEGCLFRTLCRQLSLAARACQLALCVELWLSSIERESEREEDFVMQIDRCWLSQLPKEKKKKWVDAWLGKKKIWAAHARPRDYSLTQIKPWDERYSVVCEKNKVVRMYMSILLPCAFIATS